MPTEPANAHARRLDSWDAAMVVIGGVIGAGIFLAPATVARHTSSRSACRRTTVGGNGHAATPRSFSFTHRADNEALRRICCR